MRICFALLSCLGGLAMGLGGNTDLLPFAATFFAVFGFLFVDWLKLFSLPPILAYLGMAFAGLYCIGEFTKPSRQIVAVAELLVVVQAIMMLQTKTQRVYEQIVIFCLLQLVVAAVFNDALVYGLLLIPIGFVGAWGHSLLSAFSAARFRDDSAAIETALTHSTVTHDQIFTSAQEAQWSFTRASRRVFIVACSTIAPAVLLVTSVFFYALPRTTDANRTNQGSLAMIGFKDTVELQQVGSLLRDTKQVLRIALRDTGRRTPYLVVEPMYLRGKVLEKYTFTGTSSQAGSWKSANARELEKPTDLPGATEMLEASQGSAGDNVKVSIAIESTTSPALFSLAPYFETSSRTAFRHQPLRWTLIRSKKYGDTSATPYPRLEYEFGTNSFRGGLQSEIVSVWALGDEYVELLRSREQLEVESRSGSAKTAKTRQARRDIEDSFLETQARIDRLESRYEDYIAACSLYNARRIPTASFLGDTIWNRLPADRKNRYQFARAATSYLNSGIGGYTYTLDLNFDRNELLDPIEQFLSIDKSGHCQYYASALAMILRSRGIPSRLVVGYCTDEYNSVAGHYVARQLHAHVWVEALLNRDEITGDMTGVVDDEASEVANQQCWLRLDPTPGGGGGGVAGDDGEDGVSQVLDLAQNIWKDYVVDMDSERQEQALLASATDTGMSDAYGDLIRRAQLVLLNLRAGRLGGGSLAGRELFSWPAAIMSIAAAMGLLIVLKLRLPSWIRSIHRNDQTDSVARPSLAFYAQALDSLTQIGVRRTSTHTPQEIQRHADAVASDGTRPPSEPFAKLTDLFVRARYGNQPADESEATNLLADLDDRIQTRRGSNSNHS